MLMRTDCVGACRLLVGSTRPAARESPPSVSTPQTVDSPPAIISGELTPQSANSCHPRTGPAESRHTDRVAVQRVPRVDPQKDDTNSSLPSASQMPGVYRPRKWSTRARLGCRPRRGSTRRLPSPSARVDLTRGRVVRSTRNGAGQRSIGALVVQKMSNAQSWSTRVRLTLRSSFAVRLGDTVNTGHVPPGRHLDSLRGVVTSPTLPRYGPVTGNPPTCWAPMASREQR